MAVSQIFGFWDPTAEEIFEFFNKNQVITPANDALSTDQFSPVKKMVLGAPTKIGQTDKIQKFACLVNWPVTKFWNFFTRIKG